LFFWQDFISKALTASSTPPRRLGIILNAKWNKAFRQVDNRSIGQAEP
jgi:hypothetical protein